MLEKWNLTNIGLPLKVLFTGYLCVVAIGYVMALAQILFTHGMADGKFGLSVDDIVYSYYGNRSGTMLEKMLNGPMKDKVGNEGRFRIIQWVRDGAGESEFRTQGIDVIFKKNCLGCHSAEADMGLPDFSQFKNIKERTKVDTGATFKSLIRVSHIHLFGIAFIFFFVGLIFIMSKHVPLGLKTAAIAMPFLSQLMDITSWWLTKFEPTLEVTNCKLHLHLRCELATKRKR